MANETPGHERILLVHVHTTQRADPEDIEEFRSLALAAGGDIVDLIMVNNREAQAKYFIGSGKANEIQEIVQDHKIDLVIINHSITPAQERNLSGLWKCRVVDRTGLILDIFARRARTYEGKLQVELAQLKHLATRLVRSWTHLERQKGGIGLRGPGESQLETDRRLLRLRIDYLTSRLDKVRKQREQSRQARQRADALTVSVVGYTNAGKSTLFNELTGSDVFVADQLFATLDPTVRRMLVPGIGTVVLIDTVGFIRQLPHDLVDAFRATLEETRLAHLLLHVVDASDPLIANKQAAVQQVLEEIEAEDVPQLFVYNKIDQLDIEPRIDRNSEGLPYRVWVSATTQAGINLLQQAISELLSQEYVNVTLHLPPSAGRIRAQLHERNAVTFEKTTEEGGFMINVHTSTQVLNQVFANNNLRWEDFIVK